MEISRLHLKYMPRLDLLEQKIDGFIIKRKENIDSCKTVFPMLFLICNSTVELLMRTFKTFKCLLFVATSIALSPWMFFLVRRKGKWSAMNFAILVLPKLVVSCSKKFLDGLFWEKMFDNESCLMKGSKIKVKKDSVLGLVEV